ERELDGAAAAVGAPFPVLRQLDAQQLIDFISPSPEQIASIRKQVPEITPSVIAVGTYRSLTKDYPTIGLYNLRSPTKIFPKIWFIESSRRCSTITRIW